MFKNVETLEGGNYVLQFRLLEGDVFIEHKSSSEGSHYNIQWFGKPESFGFTYKPNKANYLWAISFYVKVINDKTHSPSSFYVRNMFILVLPIISLKR